MDPLPRPPREQTGRLAERQKVLVSEYPQGIPAPRRSPDSTTTGRHRAVRRHHLEDTEHEHDRLPEHIVTGRRQHAAG